MNQCSSSAPLAANFAPTNCSAAPPDHTPSTLVALFRTHQLLEISRHDAPFRHGRQLQRRRSKRTNNHLMIITSQSNKNTHRRFCASSTRRRVLNESQPFPYKYVTFFFSYSALVLYHPSRQRDLVRRRIIAGFLVDPPFVTGSISASTRHLQAISWTCRVCGSHSASQTGPPRIIIIIIRLDQFQAAEFKKKTNVKLRDCLGGFLGNRPKDNESGFLELTGLNSAKCQSCLLLALYQSESKLLRDTYKSRGTNDSISISRFDTYHSRGIPSKMEGPLPS